MMPAGQTHDLAGRVPFLRQSAWEGRLPLASVLIILLQQQSCGPCPHKDAPHAVIT